MSAVVRDRVPDRGAVVIAGGQLKQMGEQPRPEFPRLRCATVAAR
jgi:hypothetical protein